MTLPVLIIGAGLGGACLAQALFKQEIAFKIFEQDDRSDIRTQGYRLRITELGVNALKQALTPERFTLFEKTCADPVKFGVKIKPDGKLAPTLEAASELSPLKISFKSYTVDRSVFRETLLTGLEGQIFFGKRFDHYTVHEDRVTAFFTDGTSEDGALLVGADGARSNVRQQYVPGFKGLDSGIRIVFGKTPITSEFLEKLPEEYRNGMSVVTNSGDKLQPILLFESIYFSHAEKVLRRTLPSPYMYWALLVHHSTIPTCDKEFRSLAPQEAADIVSQLTESWTPSLRVIFDMQDVAQTSTRSVLSAMPDIATWDPSSRVTLLGDSAHMMPPTGAMGANSALRDAVDLTHKIIAAGGSGNVDKGLIDAYETDLREFANKAIAYSWESGVEAFGLTPAENCKQILI